MLSITLLIALPTQVSSFADGQCQQLDVALERMEYTSVMLNGEEIVDCYSHGSAEGFALVGGVLASELDVDSTGYAIRTGTEVSVDVRTCEDGQFSGPPLECMLKPEYCIAELPDNTIGFETSFIPACVAGEVMEPGSSCFYTCDQGYTSSEYFNTENAGILRCHEGSLIEETTTGNHYPGCFPACRAPLDIVSKNLWYIPGDALRGCSAESEGSECNPDGFEHTCKFGSHDGLLKINKCEIPGGPVELECEPIICDDEMSSDQCVWTRDNLKLCEAFPDGLESEDPFGLKESYQSLRSACQKTCATCSVDDNPAVCRIPDSDNIPEKFMYEYGIEDFRLDNCFHLTDPSACELPSEVKCAQGYGGTPYVSNTCSEEDGEVTLDGCKPSSRVDLPAHEVFELEEEPKKFTVDVHYGGYNGFRDESTDDWVTDFTADWVLKNWAGWPIHFGSTTFTRSRLQDEMITLPDSLPVGRYTVTILDSSTMVYRSTYNPRVTVEIFNPANGGRLRRLIEVENQDEGENDDRRKL